MKRTCRPVLLAALSAIAAVALSGCNLLGIPDAGSELAGTISENTTLAADTVYTVTGDLTVNAALTIGEGAVLEFASNARLYIRDGRISAVGTADNPIVFRGATAVPAFWKGLQVNSSDVTNTLEYVEISHTGSGELDGERTAIMVEGFSGGALNLANVTVSDAEGYGLVVQSGGTLRSFTANTFRNIDGVPVKVDATQADALDAVSVYAGTNTTNVVEVSGTSIADDATWPALAGGVPYRVLDNLVVRSTFTVSAGATVEFDSAGILIIDDAGGAIVADGAADAPIVFTGAVQVAGYWRGIGIQSSSATNLMDYVTVSYAGHPTGFSGGDVAAIHLDGFNTAQLELTNSTVSHSAAAGVVVENGATLTESGNTFESISGSNIVYE